MPSTFDETAIGGVITGGSATYHISSRRVASGGVVVGGIASQFVVDRNTASGGVAVDGTASVRIISSRTASGGVTVGGTAPFRIRSFRTGSGGVTVGGTAFNYVGFIASGGVTVGGSGRQTFFDYESGSGGVIVGGNAVHNQQRFYRTTAVGGIVMTGTSVSNITSRRYNPLGGIQMSGSAPQNMIFHFDTSFLWNINATIISDTTFLWNTGLLINYWYRIIGLDKCPHDPCCQRYIMNVHAKSPSELCAKLTNRKYSFKIESAQRFLMPADNAEVRLQEDEGADFECNTFIDIPLCDIPLCEEFCVSYDLTEEASFDIIFVQVDADKHYEASDGAYITGSAITSYTRFLPSFSYEASGGIFVDGEAPTTSSGFNYVASGGINVSGTPYLRSTHWDFVGGEWPSTTRSRLGETTESMADDPTDQVWSLTNRVIKDDGLYSSTDVSYARTSQYLVVRGFNFEVPEDSNILHVYVTVSRKANQLTVRDLEAYILNGDEIISENKAKNVDWPYLIESQTTYDFTDSFDVEDINSYDIGFALRVKPLSSFTPTIAYVDNIAIEVVYEDSASQKVRVSGTAGVVSSSYSWMASGGVEMSGSSNTKEGFRYRPTGIGMTIGGRYGLNLSYESTGEILMGGSADARPSFQEITASGGATVGGDAIVKPYLEFGSGGATVGGNSRVTSVCVNRGTGGCVVSGLVSSPSNGIYSVVSDGGFTMGGVAGRRTESWTFHASGNIAFIFGEADYYSSDLGDFIETMEFDIDVDGMLVEFDSDKDLHDAEGVVEMLSRCGCGDIPLTLNLEQRIAKDNNFAKFLVRNSLTIQNRLTMQYNVPNDSWQCNLHYTGLAADTNTHETWDVVFDIQCTQTLGGIFIGRQIWKLGMEVTRKNTTSGISFSTRVVIGVLPDQICAANELKFKVTLDTQTGIAEITPTATIYQAVLYDDIGMFKNNAWIIAPNLVFTVSQAGLDAIQNRIDLTSDVLV